MPCACGKPIVHDDLCREHFIGRFEDTVRKTIEEYRLIRPKDRVLVAASGGKDSQTVLYLLRRFGYRVEALAIDEGIHGYRDRTLIDLERFCKKESILLKVVSFKGELGHELDAIVSHMKVIPCTPCGIFRRYLLNKHAKGYDRIATGHNLDDEVQAMAMNLFKNSGALLARQGPLVGTGSHGGFTQRIKPLIRCTEKEVRIYAFLKGFEVGFAECKYAPISYRNAVRDWLNAYEQRHPGTKRRMLDNLLAMLPSLKRGEEGGTGALRACSDCGEPSKGELCAACTMRERIEKEFREPMSPRPSC